MSVGFNKDWCQVRIATLQDRTGYRSDKTIREAINGLLLKGLIKRKTHHNSPLGDEYEILQYSSTPVPEHRSTGVENTAVLEAKTTEQLNTSVKNNSKPDDEAFKGLMYTLAELTFELTRRYPSRNDNGLWKEFAELISSEVKAAASHASNPISSVPAFLTSHLKRKLVKPEKTHKREGKRRTQNAQPSVQDTGPKTPQPMSSEEIVMFADMVRDMLADGRTMDDIEAQLKPGLTNEDWQKVTATPERSSD